MTVIVERQYLITFLDSLGTRKRFKQSSDVFTRRQSNQGDANFSLSLSVDRGTLEKKLLNRVDRTLCISNFSRTSPLFCNICSILFRFQYLDIESHHREALRCLGLTIQDPTRRNERTDSNQSHHDHDTRPLVLIVLTNFHRFEYFPSDLFFLPRNACC